MFELLVQSIITGLLVGGVYSLIAIGFIFVLGVMDVVNIAHPSFVLLAMYLTWSFFRIYNFDPFLSLIIILPLFFLFGIAIQRFLVSTIMRRSITIETGPLSLVVFFGVAIILENIISIVWTSDFRLISTAYTNTSFNIFGMHILFTYVIGFIVASSFILGLVLLLQKTHIGMTIRAVFQSKTGSLVCGINVQRTSEIIFAIGTLAAGLGGILFSLIYSFYPQLHWLWIPKLFIIMLLAGIGSIVGVFISSLIIGLIESVSTVFIPLGWIVVLQGVIILLILWFKPTGLLGRK